MLRDQITPQVLQAMSAQDVFDYAARHMMTQGYRCNMRTPNGESVCAYQNGKGGACVVGAFIPDHAYHPQMEGLRVDTLATATFIVAGYLREFFARHLELLTALQHLHDTEDPSCWERRLPELAACFGLSPRVVRVRQDVTVHQPVFRRPVFDHSWMTPIDPGTEPVTTSSVSVMVVDVSLADLLKKLNAKPVKHAPPALLKGGACTH